MWTALLYKKSKRLPRIKYTSIILLLLSQVKLRAQTTKQLKLHPLLSFWTFKYIPNYNRARWEVMLKSRLSSTLHTCQNCLPKVPTEELISWSLGIIKSLVKIFSSNTFPIS